MVDHGSNRRRRRRLVAPSEHHDFVLAAPTMGITGAGAEAPAGAGTLNVSPQLAQRMHSPRRSLGTLKITRHNRFGHRILIGSLIAHAPVFALLLSTCGHAHFREASAAAIFDRRVDSSRQS